MPTVAEYRQQLLQQLPIFDRQLNQFEHKLKQAIESDPRVVVTRLQVRRVMKTDCKVVSCHPQDNLMLLFDFVCPCGGTRREMFLVPFKWKQEPSMLGLTSFLSKRTAEHLKDEGFL